jgi:tetratricopeptide (TPR) repeat protein
MNFQNDLPLLAYLARKIRMDQGLTLENLKDENISVGTISNIENMEGNPSESKVYYLFQALGYDREGVEALKRRELSEIETLRRKLECVENMINDEDLTQAKILLSKYTPPEYHALFPYANYLKGLHTFFLNNIERSHKIWITTLDLCKKQVFLAKQHMLAKCYNELSTCLYRQNEIQGAISYIKKGINQFQKGEQSEIKYALMCNNIFYLNKSGQMKEAYECIKQIWSNIHQIQRMQVKLHLYKSRCSLLIKNNELKEAEQCCKESIQISQRNLLPKSLLLDFFNILGSIYLKQEKYELAHEYFNFVLELDAERKSPRRHADAYTYLTSLFTVRHDWLKAQECIEKALLIGRDINDDVRLTKILIISGICTKKQEKYEEAIPFFKEALVLCDKHGFLEQKYTAVYELAGCFDKIDNRKEFSQWAEEFYFLQRKLGQTMKGDFYDIL